MIKIIAAIGLGILSIPSFGQTVSYTNTVSYKLNGLIGQDATVWRTTDNTGTRDCTPRGLPTTPADLNFGDDIVGGISAWTWNAGGCPLGTMRFYIRFPELSLLGVGPPYYGVPAPTINSAVLILHGIDQNNTGGAWGSNYFPGTPLPNTNEGWLYKVQAGGNNAASPNNWDEHTITWNSAQSIGLDASFSPVSIPVTNSRYGGEQHIDVTSMVARIVRDAAGYSTASTTFPPDIYANNGFMLELQNETFYRSQAYATSDNPDSALWPELIVTYSSYGNCNLATDATFQYTNNLNSPLDFTFQANSPTSAAGYEWYVSAAPTLPSFVTPASTSPTFNYTFPNPGEYIVVMRTYFCQDVIPKWVNITVDGSTGNVSQSPQKAAPSPGGNIAPNENPQPINSALTQHLLPQDEPDLSSIVSSDPFISPNPTDNDWSVKLNVKKAGLVSIVLYDAFGKEVAAETRSVQNGTNTFNFTAANLSSGLYIMEIKGEGLNYRGKLVKR